MLIHKGSMRTLYDQLLMFGAIIMVTVTITIFILYILCTRKSRLNWFENTTLENASNKDLESEQALMSKRGELNITESNVEGAPYKYTLLDEASGYKQQNRKGKGDTHCTVSRQSSLDAMTPVTCSQKHLILSSVPLALPRVAFVQSKGDQDPLESGYTYTAESKKLLRLLEV